MGEAYHGSMKQFGKLFILASAVLAPLVASTAAQAAPSQPGPGSIVQELHVTAVVPGHRDIVLDLHGNIQKIYSNTTADVTPTVYTLEISDTNRQLLTDELFEAYRRLVPEGTAKYGVLYNRQAETASIKTLLTVPRPDNKS
jgi:hypothetical protein